MQKGLNEKLSQKTLKDRIPMAAHLEVTHRCNLECKHCFHRGLRNDKSGELDTGDWKKLMDALKNQGTMFLIITGGEPFLREDISRLLLYASKVPFSIMIFTNGVLIDEEKAKFIASLNPFAVHISLYSLQKEIHEKITGRAGSFEKTMKAINLLKEKEVNTVVKCPLMKENFKHVDSLRQWADKKDITLKIDPVISPCYEKNCTDIVSHRLDLEAMSDMVFDSGIFDLGDFRPREGLKCGAGRNMVTVDSAGRIYPCVAWRNPAGNIKKEEFRDIWKKMKPDYEVIESCRGCSLLPYCGVCPGIAAAEGKELFCAMARKLSRRSELRQISNG
ncbi:MAG: radical SAM protein [Elusimicrobiota bacterium]